MEASGGTIRTKVPARMDRLPWARWHWLVVLGLGSVWVLDGLEVTIVGAIGARLQEPGALGLSAAQIGQAGTAYVLGACAGALFFGYLTDRLGRKRLFILTLTLYLIATVATAFSFSFWSFAFFRFMTGMGIGGEYAAINSAIDELIPARARGWVDLAINGSFWVGASFGAAMSGLLLDQSIFAIDVGWRVAFGLGALLAVAILVVRRTLQERPRWLMVHGKVDEADELVSKIERQVLEQTGRDSLPEPEGEIEIQPRESINFVDLGRTLFRKYPRRAWLGFILMTTQAFLYNAVVFNYAGLLVGYFGVGEDVAGLYLVPFGIANFIGALTLGRLFDTVGRRPMITATYLIGGIGMLVNGYLVANSDPSAGLYVGILCFTFLFASAAASAAYLTVSEIFPLETRAMAIAFFYAIATGFGGAIGPLYFGGVVESADPNALFLAFGLAAGAMIFAALAELIFGVEAAQMPLEDVAEPLSAEEAGEAKAARPSRRERREAQFGPRRGPEARPYPGRRAWAPATMATTQGEDRDIEREVEEMVDVLRDKGPMSRRGLRQALSSRYWGPDRFARALRLAQRRGLIRREGGSLVATVAEG
jgi:MFS family permease